MEELRTRFDALKARFDALSVRARVGAFAAVGVAIAAAVLFLARGSDAEMEVLFTGLSGDDSTRIVQRLSAMGVRVDTGEDGTIRVPADRVHETRLTLASEGLPSGGGVGFEIFDTARFGESDFSEQVQFRRALEGELARTISHLAGVQRARVHLVLPERSLFATDENQASASVALHLTPGWRLRDEQVEGVAHLVASSVRGLTPERVTVVDQEGRPLSRAGGEDGAVTDGGELRQQIETSRQRAVQQLLDASLGQGVAVVRVSADVNMAREEQVYETYDPERVATRSVELLEERDPNAQGGGQGIPGAASNLPGGAAAEAPGEGNGLSRRSERRNFEITKTVRRAVQPVGRIARITVAVVVDGTWTGEGDERAFSARDDAEIARIRGLVSTAAGLDEERGDIVTVECVPFASSAAPPVAIEVDPVAEIERWAPIGGGALIGLVVLIALLVMWRKRAKKKKEEAKAEKSDEARALGAGESDDPTALPSPVDVVDAPSAAETLGDYEALRALAHEVARRDPELAARVVRGWLQESSASQATEEAA